MLQEAGGLHERAAGACVKFYVWVKNSSESCDIYLPCFNGQTVAKTQKIDDDVTVFGLVIVNACFSFHFQRAPKLVVSTAVFE